RGAGRRGDTAAVGAGYRVQRALNGYRKEMMMPESVEAAAAERDGRSEAPLAVVFDREGEPVASPREADLVIEPEEFLAGGGDVPTARRLAEWMAEHGAAPAVA